MSAPVRLALVGLGNIGRKHLQNLQQGRVRNAELAVTCSPAPTAPVNGVDHVRTWQELISRKDVDGAVVAVPTHSHVEVGRGLLQAGIALLMEKPLARSVDQAQSLLAAAPPGLPFSVMLNQRLDGAYARIKALLDEGELGAVRRVHWSMTQWYRPNVYFAVSRWRGTWPGEGGGVLINQAIHNLDVLQWLVGMPQSVRASAAFGKYHDIEVEDEVTAMLGYANGVTASLVASTGEAPGVNQLDVVCDGGTLRYDGAALDVYRSAESVAHYTRTTHDMFGLPEHTHVRERDFAEVDQHAVLLQNFVDAVGAGAKLLTPAAQGLNSLSLANAILLSAWEDRTVTFPLDSARYEAALHEKTVAASLREPRELDVEIDIDKSFR